MPDERCRCQHKVDKHEYGVGRCVCGCGWFGSVEEFNRRAAEQYRRSIGGPERVAVSPGRDCMCPAQNPDCQHPTCPRYPQPGHLELEVQGLPVAVDLKRVAALATTLKQVRDLAKRARRDGVLLDPQEVLAVVSEEPV